MIALIQRVKSAKVTVANKTVGEINNGLLLFIGLERNDTPTEVAKLVKKVVNYRVFEDRQGKMNLSSLDIEAELLAVSQFTLAADTKSGTRAGFSSALAPELAAPLFELFSRELKSTGLKVATGVFGAQMEVELINDGPVTFWLQV